MSASSLLSLSSLSQGNLAVSCKSGRSFLQYIQVSSPGPIPPLLSNLDQVFPLLRDSFSPYESWEYSGSDVLWIYGVPWVEHQPTWESGPWAGQTFRRTFIRSDLHFQKAVVEEAVTCVGGGKKHLHGQRLPLFLAIPRAPRPPKQCLLPSMCAVRFTSHPFFHFSLDFWDRFWHVQYVERRWNSDTKQRVCSC